MEKWKNKKPSRLGEGEVRVSISSSVQTHGRRPRAKREGPGKGAVGECLTSHSGVILRRVSEESSSLKGSQGCQ